MSRNQTDINVILLFLIGFFATWGEGMQKVFSKSAIIYPLLVVLYIALNNKHIFPLDNRKRLVPKEFRNLFLFILIHTIFYMVLNFQTVSFGTEGGVENDEGFSYGKAANGNTIIRYFLFLLFCIYLTVALSDIKKMKVFAVAYVLGFVCTVLGGSYHVYGYLIRISGGLDDPNTMALDALVSLMLSFYLLDFSHSTKKRILLFIAVLIEILAIILTFSRGAYLALFLWFVMYIFRQGIRRNLGKIILGTFSIVLIGNYAIKYMDVDTDILTDRFSYETMNESKGANRGMIWEAYLSNMDKYFVTGMGMANSPMAIKGNKLGVMENYETHNIYITFFVEFGIIGLVLFLMYLLKVLINFPKTQDNSFFLISIGVLFMIINIFLSLDKGRTFWIVLAILNMIILKNSRRRLDVIENNNNIKVST